MKVYKVRDIKTGLFTKGGLFAEGSFSKDGKIWGSLKNLISFLKYFARTEKDSKEDIVKRYPTNNSIELESDIHNYIPKDWEIVEFDLIESGQNNSAREVLKNVQFI